MLYYDNYYHLLISPYCPTIATTTYLFLLGSHSLTASSPPLALVPMALALVPMALETVPKPWERARGVWVCTLRRASCS